jgi:hypothetical protein
MAQRISKREEKGMIQMIISNREYLQVITFLIITK